LLQGRREPTEESDSISGKLGGKLIENDRNAPEMGAGEEASGEHLRKTVFEKRS
jgi:hypothetical protein